MKRPYAILVMLFLAISIAGIEKRPFSLDDLYLVKSIGSLQLSPNGTILLFSVTGYDSEAAGMKTHLYQLNLATNELKQLTFHDQGDFDPFWSPDEKNIYFLSSRESGVQLWSLPSSGGEAKKLTCFHTGIFSPQISQDGNRIVFQSTVFPECGADSDCNKTLSDMLRSSPVRAHLTDKLLYRQWSSYRDWKYSHIFSYDIEKGKIEAITSGELDFPASFGGFSIAPSGKEICVVGKEEEHPATSTNKDLFLISINSDEKLKTRITAENKAADGAPQFSPNGNYIAHLMQRIPDYESDRIRLAIYDRQTKKRTALTEDLDNWVNGFIWSPDSRYIYFKVQEKGRYPVYRVEVDSANIERILDAHSPGSMVITPNGKEIIFTRYSFTEPGDIWSYRIGEKQSLKRLTFFNEKLENQVDIRPAEEHWVTGAGGKKIHMFIIKPHDFDPEKKYPMILNIHGGPQQMWDDSFWGDYQVYPGSGYIVALPNLRGSVGYGQDFTAAISGDYGGKVMEDIEKVSDYLASFPYVDKDRMGAMGWSWGGYAIMWLEGHTQRFKALASMMGLFDLASFYGSTEELWFPEWDLKGTPWDNEADYRRFSPSSYIKNFKTPCLVITGEKDYRVPYTQSLQFFTALQKMGVPSRLIIFPNDGHVPNPDSMRLYYNAHLEWFHKYIGGKPAPYSSENMIRNMINDE